MRRLARIALVGLLKLALRLLTLKLLLAAKVIEAATFAGEAVFRGLERLENLVDRLESDAR
jgi:hypothetical protein